MASKLQESVSKYSARELPHVVHKIKLKFRRHHQLPTYNMMFKRVHSHSLYRTRTVDDFYMKMVTDYIDEIRAKKSQLELPFETLQRTNEQLPHKNITLRLYHATLAEAKHKKTVFLEKVETIQKLIKTWKRVDVDKSNVLYLCVFNFWSKLPEDELVTDSSDFFMFDIASIKGIIDLTTNHNKKCEKELQIIVY